MSNATGQPAAMRSETQVQGQPEIQAIMAAATDDATGAGARIREVLREAVLHELSPSERLFVVLRWCEQMTLAEIGAVMDMTELQSLRMQRVVLELLRRHVTESAAGA